jgi:uncharacterized membrane protein YfcA
VNDLLLVALAGFVASFVDGALGMGFGPTSSSILLSSGLTPVGASATINLAKIATGAVAAVSHWRFGNIDRSIVLRLAVPGAAGAVVGATILATVDSHRLRPVLAVLLMSIGLRILWRFSRSLPAGGHETGDVRRRGIALAGAAGGVTNGMIGAWGPVVTPFLLHRGVHPRHVVGSVNTAEVAVAVVAAGSILTAGSPGIDAATVLAMLIGGVLASPIAAWGVRFVPARVLGVLVAGLLLVTNARELANWADLSGSRWFAYTAVGVLVGAAAARPRFASGRPAIA